jgi:hypothetical protein
MAVAIDVEHKHQGTMRTPATAENVAAAEPAEAPDTGVPAANQQVAETGTQPVTAADEAKSEAAPDGPSATP